MVINITFIKIFGEPVQDTSGGSGVEETHWAAEDFHKDSVVHMRGSTKGQLQKNKNIIDLYEG